MTTLISTFISEQRKPFGRQWLLLVAMLTFSACAIWRMRDFYHDDAYITLRYVDRWLMGHGLTWNDNERVEGFTHPLWLMQVAALGALHVPLEATTRILGVSYVFALLLLLWRVSYWPFVFCLIATQPGFLLWSVGGLETTCFAFWVTTGAWFIAYTIERTDGHAIRYALLAGLSLTAAALTRPEGVAVGLMAIAWLAIVRREAWRLSVYVALVFLIPLAGYLIFRIAYYNELLPNSVYAKAGHISLDRRLAGTCLYLKQYIGCWLPSTVAVLFMLWAARTHRALGVLALTLPLWCGVVLGAGDHMPAGRFLVPIMALFALAAGLCGPISHTRVRPWIVSIVCAAAGTQAILAWQQPAYRDPAAAIGAPVGRYLRSMLAPGALVATATAGSTPYYAPSLEFVDTLGINDRHIAHREIGPALTKWQSAAGHFKGDGAYVLSRTPDVIIIGPAEGVLAQEANDWFLTDYELSVSSEFHRLYRPFLFYAPITPKEATHWRMQHLLFERSHRWMQLIAYLRTDSPQAQAMALHGTALADL